MLRPPSRTLGLPANAANFIIRLHITAVYLGVIFPPPYFNNLFPFFIRECREHFDVLARARSDIKPRASFFLLSFDVEVCNICASLTDRDCGQRGFIRTLIRMYIGAERTSGLNFE